MTRTAPRAAPPFRRLALTLALVLSLAAVLAWPVLRNAYWAAVTEETAARVLSPAEAHARAAAGEILLVDIRRPEEWAATGIPEGAVALDMRRPDFTDALRMAAGDSTAPVALICARGVRSAALANRLAAAGFSSLLDVPEGMLGSRAGPGWLARSLPVVPCPSALCS